MHWTDAGYVLRSALMGVAAFTAGLATPALAADSLSTKLVSCGEKSCLLVTGRRADASAPVMINDRAVTVEGARKWRVRVPVDTLREWSAPFAQTVKVSVAGVSDDAALPIGMFMGNEHIAMLTVTAK